MPREPLSDDEKRKQKRAYDAARYVARKAEIRARNKAWNEANKDRAAATQANWAKENAEKMAAYYRNYRAVNRDKLREKNRTRLAETGYGAKYYAANKERRLLANAEWVRNNRDIARRHWANRQIAKRSRIPPWFGEFDEFVMAEAYDVALRRERAGCEWHVDHVLPLRARHVSGLHCGLNIQVLPAILNLRKRNKLWLTEPGEWLRHV